MLVEAQKLVLESWAVLAAVFLGIGLVERRLFGPPVGRARDLWQVFWTGWALLLSLLQVWHLFAPVDDSARVAVAVVAAAGWLLAGTAPWRAIVRALPRNAVAVVAVAAAALWLSNRSLAGPRYGDTGMYLIPTIHWYQSYAAVPGLANLFVPLGHNISYFLYGALLDGGPLAHRIYHVINSVLAMAVLARSLFACGSLLRRRDSRSAADLFYALALFPMGEMLFQGFLTSPMPEIAVYLLGIVLAGELVAFVAERAPSRADLVRLGFLCAVALTVKLSLAGMAISTAGLALGWWIWRKRPGAKDAATATLLVALAGVLPVGTWVVRNLVSSGYPFYPAKLLPLPVDWIMRIDATAWIQAPMAMAPLSMMFRDPAWWRTHMLSLGWMEPDVTRPLFLVAGAAAVYAISRPLAWWRSRRGAVPLVILVAPLAAFAFCFVNAPMPRFQGATIWIAAVEFAVMALAPWGRAARILAVALSLAGAALPLSRGAEPWLDLHDFEQVSPPRIHSETLASGLVVNVPEGQVCWYAPLPCSPEPPPGLRLREPGNLAAGFAIDPATLTPPVPAP